MDIKEMVNNPEPLNIELQAYLDSDNGFMPMIKHPLYFALPYIEQMNPMYNKSFEYKKKIAKEYLDSKKYSSYVFIHERPYRLMAFLNIMDNLKGREYWELLADLWIDSENIWQNKSVYRNLFKYHPNHKKYFMNKEDRKVFDSLPEQVVVYRGYLQGKNKTGFSYTLDKSRAEWFSNRFGSGKVLTRKVPKDKIIAYTNRRNEQEVIINY